MQTLIKQKLGEIQSTHNVRILYACESGSRAWNFASKDSDYDVRFVYVRDMAWYLALNQKRDVIEMPILNELDINGWDLAKFLKLAYKGNVVAFEWLKSPVIYAKSTLWDELSAVCERYFSVPAALYHYYNIAGNQYRLYIVPPDIKIKKFFYVLRPLLAFFYIKIHATPAPMDFLELFEFGKKSGLVDGRTAAQMQTLYEMKTKSNEFDKADALEYEPLLNWIDDKLKECEFFLESEKSSKKLNIKPLDELFYKAVVGDKNEFK